MNVLLIDDDKNTTAALADLVLMMGHTPTKAHNGKEALGAAQGCVFDLILMDISLPDISGHDVCFQLRQSTKHVATRIIAVTGYHSFGEAEGASCFNDFMLKPISFSDLEALLLQ